MAERMHQGGRLQSVRDEWLEPGPDRMIATRRLRILTFTTLFPNAAQPNHGIFVESRLRHLNASGQVECVVVAPSPWFPFQAGCFGSYARFARVPPREQRHGIVVHHPRYPAL